MRRTLAVLAVGLLVGCSSPVDNATPTPSLASTSAPAEPEPARISVAATECGIDHLVEQDGASIVTVSLAQDIATATWDQVTCLLEGLDAPSFVTDRILHESSKGETLTETWDGLEVRWSYTDLKTGYRVTVIDRELT